jgi:hypothetical protein
MIRLLVIFFALAAPTLSQAEVKAFGTFVPSLCSLASNQSNPRAAVLAVKSACLGKIAGFRTEALLVVLNDNSSVVYDINVNRNPNAPRMGLSSAPFTGAIRGQAASGQVEGVLVVTSGVTVSWNLRFKTSSNLKFAGAVRPVLTTQ